VLHRIWSPKKVFPASEMKARDGKYSAQAGLRGTRNVLIKIPSGTRRGREFSAKRESRITLSRTQKTNPDRAPLAAETTTDCRTDRMLWPRAGGADENESLGRCSSRQRKSAREKLQRVKKERQTGSKHKRKRN
jgi:hypothetical protein